MQAKNFAVLIALAIFFFLIDLIRRQKMTFKYSLSWLAASVSVICLGFSEGLLFRLSEWAGFEVPSNFVFFLALAFFIVLCLLLTVYVNEQNSRTEALTQAVGILRYQIEKLRKEKA